MIKIKNNATSVLASDISSTDTSLTIQTGDEAKFPVINNRTEYFYVTLQSVTDETKYEIVKVTQTNNNTFTVERAQQDTTAQNFSANDIVELRITTETVTDLIQDLNNSKRRYLDVLIGGLQNSSVWPSLKLKAYNERLAPKLVKKWDSYIGDKIYIQLDFPDIDKTLDELKADTLNDLNQLCIDEGSDGSYYQSIVIIRPYEKIDNSIPTPTRIYGYNRFLGALKGKKSYDKTINSALYSKSRMNQPCVDIFNTMFGTSYTTSDDVTSIKRTLWIPNAKVNKYGTVTQNYRISFDAKKDTRSIYNTNTNTFINITDAVANPYYVVDSLATPTYFGLSDNLSVRSYSNYSDLPTIIDKFSAGYSFVHVVKMRSTTEPDHKALVVKPLGIDYIMMEYPDFDKYILEFVAVGKYNQPFVDVIGVDSLQPWMARDLNGRKIRFNISVLMDLILLQKSERIWYNDAEPLKVFFRYRDKTTNAVGELSHTYVTCDIKPSRNIIRFLLGNRND